MRHRRRGLSLIEICVAMFVLGLVTLATLNVFLPALSGLQQADTEYDAQRNVLIALNRVAADLRESRLSWVSIGGDYVAIPTSRDARGNFAANSDGTPAWTGWIIYWLAPDPNEPRARQLLRHAFLGSFTPPTPNTLFAPPPFPSTAHVVATGVTAFNVTASSRSSGGSANVHIETLRNYQSRDTTFKGDKTVELFY